MGLQPKMMSIDQWSEAIITTRHNDGLGDVSHGLNMHSLLKLIKVDILIYLKIRTDTRFR